MERGTGMGRDDQEGGKKRARERGRGRATLAKRGRERQRRRGRQGCRIRRKSVMERGEETYKEEGRADGNRALARRMGRERVLENIVKGRLGLLGGGEE